MIESEPPSPAKLSSAILSNTLLQGEREYAWALDWVIAKANNQLIIFDQDFSKGGYASLNRYTLMKNFLQKGAHAKLTIILQNTQFFKMHCPRLMDLLRLHGHQITIFETNDFAKIAKDCFVVADKHDYCRRFHIDQSRFKFGNANEDAATVSGLLLRFDELLDETISTISTTSIGL